MPLWTHDGEGWVKVNLHKKDNTLAAFICCGGPSLNEITPLYLRGPNRMVVALNNTYPKIQPDMWIGTDVPDCYDAALFYEAFPKIMRGSYGDTLVKGVKVKELNSVYFADLLAEGDKVNRGFNFTKDDIFYWPKNTFEFAIQFVMWMGIKTIYFFGVDLNNEKKHYFDGSYLTKKQQEYNALLYNQLYTALEELTPRAQEAGYSLYSCSPGSKINTFLEYRNYLDVIRDLEAVVPHGRLRNHVLDKSPD